jgi:hypothetical protein
MTYYDELFSLRMLKFSDQELQQCRANLQQTCAISLGHLKGDMNILRREMCVVELKKRGLEVDESVEGVFNGDGSW